MRRILAAAIGVAGCFPKTNVTETVAVGSTPTVFAPVIVSDTNFQWRVTFTPDGRTAYFAESPQFFPVSRTATIYRSQWTGDRWSDPEVASFSGQFSDMDPVISPDGSRLYFSSIRPVAGVIKRDIDIWMTERRSSSWSEPVRLGSEVNTEADELYPSVSRDGTLYFASGPIAPGTDAHFDIYQARAAAGGFSNRERLSSSINTAPAATDPHPQAAWEFNPEISADGQMLVFASLRPGGAGLGDLYVSHRAGNDWTPAQSLGPVVNTAADEYHPTLSRDGRALYFVRRGPGKGDFFVIATSAIGALRR